MLAKLLMHCWHAEQPVGVNGDVSPVAAAFLKPASWAMMILGLGAVGFAKRRRRKNAKTTVGYAA